MVVLMGAVDGPATVVTRADALAGVCNVAMAVGYRARMRSRCACA
jgi:hypothetical protein